MPKKSKKRGPGRPSFEPTDEMRRLVSALAGYGAPQEYIATQVINPKSGKPITKPTLEKHFRAELDLAMTDKNVKAVESLFVQAVGRPAEYDKDGKLIRAELAPSTAAAIFWCKARLGWSDRVEFAGRIDSEVTVTSTARERVTKKLTSLSDKINGRVKAMAVAAGAKTETV